MEGSPATVDVADLLRQGYAVGWPMHRVSWREMNSELDMFNSASVHLILYSDINRTRQWVTKISICRIPVAGTQLHKYKDIDKKTNLTYMELDYMYTDY